MSYRNRLNEIDQSAIVLASNNEVGAMVINSSKGKYKYCQSEADVLRIFGKPSAVNPEVFEAIAFCRKAPCHIFSALHDDALYGGVGVSISGIAGLSSGSSSETFDFTGYPDISHVFLTASPYRDDLKAKVTYMGGYKFKLELYQYISTGTQLVNTYNYSLIREKDGFGKSLYYSDVFKDDDYVIPQINPNFSFTNYNLSGLTADFSGGSRGTTPTAGDYTTAWNNFAKKSKYPAKIFMDVNGNSTATINSIIQNYQPRAQGLSIIPMGNNAQQAITYRNTLGLDSSDVALYTNWAEIRDDYNDSYAWISDIGSVGGKWALMSDVYDAEAPAGIDETNGNKHGGQLNSWTYIKREQDYTDTDYSSELQSLDEAQINPIIKDEIYGHMAYGNKTMQVSTTSKSFIGTNRLYKYMEDNIQKNILRAQEFKINDASHRNKARTLINNFLTPIANRGYLYDTHREAYDTFLAVDKEWHEVKRMFSDCLEELREIN